MLMNWFTNLSDILKWVIIWWWISLLTAILTATISYYFNSRQQRKERKYQTNKEQFFKLQEKIEIIFKWLDAYRLQVVLLSKNMKNNVHFEEDFIGDKIKERFWPNRELMSQYTYIYFKELYDNIKEFIALHDEILNKYFDWLGENRARTDEENAFFFEKMNAFSKKHVELLDKFLDNIDQKRRYLYL